MNRLTINKEVAITAVYFRRQLQTVPKRMEFDGNIYDFAESGLQYLVKRGEQMVRLFDMSDGAATYRLKRDDSQNSWTLLSITPNA